MNTFNKLGGYLKGVGANPMYQNIADYGSAAALGVAGQQAMNWVSPGADPNPLLSGALMAPALAYGGRAVRQGLNPSSMDQVRLNASLDDNKQLLALIGSGASLAGGSLTSGINTIAGGNDIDNNIVGGSLGAIAPLTLALMMKYKGSKSPSIS